MHALVVSLLMLLSAEQVRDGLASVRPKIMRCQNETSDDHVVGKLVVAFEIVPSGKVGDVQLGGELAQSVIGPCVIREMKKATFPPFTGEPMKVKYPFVFN
jgi:hypothetical protein